MELHWAGDSRAKSWRSWRSGHVEGDYSAQGNRQCKGPETRSMAIMFVKNQGEPCVLSSLRQERVVQNEDKEITDQEWGRTIYICMYVYIVFWAILRTPTLKIMGNHWRILSSIRWDDFSFYSCYVLARLKTACGKTVRGPSDKDWELSPFSKIGIILPILQMRKLNDSEGW